MQRRLQSKVLWVALFALIGFVLKTYFDVDMQEYDTATNLLLSVLIALGVVNNPEQRDRL